MDHSEWKIGDRFMNISNESIADVGAEGVIVDLVGKGEDWFWVLYDSPYLRERFKMRTMENRGLPTGSVRKDVDTMGRIYSYCGPAIPVDPVPEESESLWSLPKTW